MLLEADWVTRKKKEYDATRTIKAYPKKLEAICKFSSI
jgi:hypothetical protein